MTCSFRLVGKATTLVRVMRLDAEAAFLEMGLALHTRMSMLPVVVCCQRRSLVWESSVRFAR